MARWLLAIVVMALLGAYAWWHWNEAPAPTRTVEAAPAGKPSLPVDSVLQVRPAPAAAAQSPVSTTRRAAKTPAMAQFHARKDYASLYRALEGDSSSEALYLRAEVYALCTRRGAKFTERHAVERAEIAASLAQMGASAKQRLDALDRMSRDPCEGLDLGMFDRQALTRMLTAAADGGDVRAQAWLLAERIERAQYERQTTQPMAAANVLADEDFADARRLLLSGDPDVILELRGMLSSSVEHASVRLGGEPVDNAALFSAFQLLACDVGANCGADSPDLLMNCAYRGRCAATTLYDYMFYYESSPSEAQLIDSYRRQLAAMVNAGDFSGLTLSRSGGTPGFSMHFGGRRLDPDLEPPAPKALGTI